MATISYIFPPAGRYSSTCQCRVVIPKSVGVNPKPQFVMQLLAVVLILISLTVEYLPGTSIHKDDNPVDEPVQA
jgi:hypothetical protein